MKSMPCPFASDWQHHSYICFWTFWVRSLTMCSHARRRPLTCKAVEKQKRVPNAIKNSSRLVTGAAASQIIHFLLAGLTLAACSKVLLIKSCGGLSHGGWRSRYHCNRESAAQDGPNDFPPLLASSVFGLIKTWCTSNWISDHAAGIDEFSKNNFVLKCVDPYLKTSIYGSVDNTKR